MAGAVGAVDLLSKGYIASEAITKNRFVKLDAEGSIDMCDTAGEVVGGVSMEAADSDDVTAEKRVGVQHLGIAVVEAATAITIQALVRTDGSGKATVLAGTTEDQNVAGIALTTAAADGDLINVLLTPGGQSTTT